MWEVREVGGEAHHGEEEVAAKQGQGEGGGRDNLG